MAKNFLAGPSLKAQGQRNGFDMSYQNQFTVPFGMLLPCFFQRVNPDDKIDLSLESQTICDGLTKPAFMRLKEHWDYYFIPATQLWMPFDNFVTGQNSYFSQAVSYVNDGKVPANVPCMTAQALQTELKLLYTNQAKDEQGFLVWQGAFRLLDQLGYFNLSPFYGKVLDDPAGEFNIFNDDSSLYNLFPLLCYQKVYYDFYRNPKYEDNRTQCYNVDDLQDGYIISTLTDISPSRFASWLSVHYRWQKKDYFTQTQPQVLPMSSDIGYSDLAQISVSNLLNVPGLPYGTATLVDNVGTSSTLNKGQGVFVAKNANSQTPSLATNVTAIRFAFAYDRLLRRMRQAGPDFDSQMLAQYGIRPYDARHGKCTYLGGYTNNLSSKDVTNMTGDGIGDLAGQINSYSDNTKRHLHYHAKEHGYIIGIYSTSVDNMYQSFRSSREVLLRNRFDWFNSAFENLGLQPVFSCEYDYTGNSIPADNAGLTYDKTSRTSIMGYVPRYSELKTHPDECHGLLCNYSNVVGFREWNVQTNQRKMLQQPYTVFSKANLQLNPSQFDPVAGIAYDGTPYTDHFVVNCYTHSKKVSSMSVYEEF